MLFVLSFSLTQCQKTEDSEVLFVPLMHKVLPSVSRCAASALSSRDYRIPSTRGPLWVHSLGQSELKSRSGVGRRMKRPENRHSVSPQKKYTTSLILTSSKSRQNETIVKNNSPVVFKLDFWKVPRVSQHHPWGCLKRDPSNTLLCFYLGSFVLSFHLLLLPLKDSMWTKVLCQNKRKTNLT